MGCKLCSRKGWRKGQSGAVTFSSRAGRCRRRTQDLAANRVGYNPTPLLINASALSHSVTVGCSVKVRGVLADSPGKGQAKELKAEAVEILGPSDAEVSRGVAVLSVDGAHHTSWYRRRTRYPTPSRAFRSQSFVATPTFVRAPIRPPPCSGPGARCRSLSQSISG